MQSSHATADHVPDLSQRRELSDDEMLALDEPAAIFEYSQLLDDGQKFFAYTVAGWLHGRNVATINGGCTYNGDAMSVTAYSRDQADEIACSALDKSISLLRELRAKEVSAEAAKTRLTAIGAVERLNQAMSGNNSDFKKDVDLVRVAHGDSVYADAFRSANRS